MSAARKVKRALKRGKRCNRCRARWRSTTNIGKGPDGEYRFAYICMRGHAFVFVNGQMVGELVVDPPVAKVA